LRYTGIKVLVKFHPDCQIPFSIIEKLNLSDYCTLTKDPLIDLLKVSDIVFCGNSTTSSVEALWLGIPTVIMRIPSQINLNPMFGVGEVRFVNSGEELKLSLDSPLSSNIPKSFFFLDQEYPLWKKTINEELC